MLGKGLCYTHSVVKAAELAYNTSVSGLLTYRSYIKQEPYSVGKKMRHLKQVETLRQKRRNVKMVQL